MENDIFETLQELKRIKPNSEYAKHSRMLILASPQHMIDSPHVSTFFRVSAMISAGVIALVMILGGTTYINETYSPLALEGLNQKSLTAEANEINDSIEITLETIDYLETSNQTTLKKITEISKLADEPTAARTMMMAAPTAPEATSTNMESFLIKSDTTAESTATEPPTDTINTILDKVSE
ncbi:MAG: hypothetical protein UY31_C0038G0009 [Candidatus Wolfebacteria bacterium GW2011_GWE1_48_7]|uniref:Uncharacterized protein n=2 Tax=Candidatus Wolfeibacteriota TaxID=1752735 RepID=A0A0G1WGA4_9BACT|nr:MAG: hypothetical protein UX70_C0001G1018 [Candidatus Wolfebacteria bacterium GW2011_GWB1_47_1]KKU36622.1 MAG: hypothetical protein UX49_C0012G0003 [Candidatus Wolfebacteria bacterium GW2011_GWC2_46_275]KKU41480.1 MAG: hypothetical protein UX58_C0008G0046 [Candidatus Wolfebacteria bacterium GW2011_GWB2_46_69]KKU53580.1 MAG: hypothetical protein UX76_C0013G0008 [Candidatus Wolfebacteria bacterium GW2011_GWC1_47_103]KKU58811.1 MAG: hypothetical protein UX83_C0011G0023 [Candidatus Wolfebacteria